MGGRKKFMRSLIRTAVALFSLAVPSTADSLAPAYPASDTEMCEEAVQDRNRVTKRMTPDQIAQADFSYERDGHGVTIRGDTAEALRLIRRRAEQGDASAQFSLGMITQDYTEAMKWFRLSAKQGDTGAQLSIGEAYEYGHGVPRDYSEAMRWYHLAAEHGYAYAQFRLGVIYRNGGLVPQDYVEAVKWFRLAAEQNSSSAMRNLGDMYANGWGVPKDDVEAAKWYRKRCDLDPEACDD